MVSISSCAREEHSKVKLKISAVSNEKIKLSDYFDAEFLPLNTKHADFPYSLEKIVASDNFYLMIRSSEKPKIWVYNRSGDLLNIFSKSNFIDYPSDALVNSSGEIEILDATKGSILTFESDSFSFDRKIDLSFRASSFAKLNDMYAFRTIGEPEVLSVSNTNGERLFSKFDYNISHNFKPVDPIIQSSDNIYFRSHFDPMIYSVNKDG